MNQLLTLSSIKAIFAWQLTEDNTLNHPGVIQIPGNPLDIAIVSTADAAPKLVVAADPSGTSQAKSLSIFTLTTNGGRLSTETAVVVNDDAIEIGELEITEKETRGLLYNVETLRKQPTEQGGEDAAEEQGMVAEGE